MTYDVVGYSLDREDPISKPFVVDDELVIVIEKKERNPRKRYMLIDVAARDALEYSEVGKVVLDFQ